MRGILLLLIVKMITVANFVLSVFIKAILNIHLLFDNS